MRSSVGLGLGLLVAAFAFGCATAPTCDADCEYGWGRSEGYDTAMHTYYEEGSLPEKVEMSTGCAALDTVAGRKVAEDSLTEARECGRLAGAAELRRAVLARDLPCSAWDEPCLKEQDEKNPLPKDLESLLVPEGDKTADQQRADAQVRAARLLVLLRSTREECRQFFGRTRRVDQEHGLAQWEQLRSSALAPQVIRAAEAQAGPGALDRAVRQARDDVTQAQDTPCIIPGQEAVIYTF